MIWLITQMILCLLAAFLLGMLTYWFLFCRRRSSVHADASYSGTSSAHLSASGDADGDVDWDGDSLQAELARCRSDLADAHLEIERLEGDLATSANVSADVDASVGSGSATIKSSLTDDSASSGDFSLESSDRPEALSAPQSGAADDLQRIKGVGPKLEKTLHGLGIYHFQQIADFTCANVEWVDGYLTFKGRIDREDWIGQAKVLAKGGTTDFSKRYDKNET